MYDPLTGRYAFACPVRGETHVLLSAFRTIEQLPGAAHPAVFRVLPGFKKDDKSGRPCSA